VRTYRSIIQYTAVITDSSKKDRNLRAAAVRTGLPGLPLGTHCWSIDSSDEPGNGFLSSAAAAGIPPNEPGNGRSRSPPMAFLSPNFSYQIYCVDVAIFRTDIPQTFPGFQAYVLSAVALTNLLYSN
jgi:hypothetical protein